MKVGHYIYKHFELLANINGIKDAFHFVKHLKLAYSIKANYYSKILQDCKQNDFHFDCASENELNILLKEGIPPSLIWINTPFLSETLIDLCLKETVLINLDNIDQLELIQKKAERFSKQVRIGIRVHFETLDHSRFGIASTGEEMHNVLKLIEQSEHIELIGLHTHYSGSNRSVDHFAKRTILLIKFYQDNWPNGGLQFLNVGGGLSGPMPEAMAQQLSFDPPSWLEYANAIQSAWGMINDEEINLILEPGMALVANVFDFEAEVVGFKERGEKTQALITASKTFLKPTGHQKDLVFEVNNYHPVIAPIKQYELVGISCMESDILGEYKGELHIGDKITFKNMGAYTLSFSPDFIFTKPEVRVKSE